MWNTIWQVMVYPDLNLPALSLARNAVTKQWYACIQTVEWDWSDISVNISHEFFRWPSIFDKQSGFQMMLGHWISYTAVTNNLETKIDDMRWPGAYSSFTVVAVAIDRGAIVFWGNETMIIINCCSVVVTNSGDFFMWLARPLVSQVLPKIAEDAVIRRLITVEVVYWCSKQAIG